MQKRDQLILSAVIEEHLATGEPVGSKVLAERFASQFGLSAATIRNLMGELEDAGLLAHPHTSAGRIPTDAGYRFYVDNLLGVLQISPEDLTLINEHLGVSSVELQLAPQKFLERTSQLLSNLSNNVGIVVSPSLSENQLEHIKFVSLSDKRILVILVSAPSLVNHKVVRLEQTLPQDDLDRTANYLNKEFAGRSLTEIRRRILNLMHEEKSLFDRMLQTAIILCSDSLPDANETAAVYVDGASNILSKPDFADFAKLRELLRTIEEKSRLVKILNECIRPDQSLQSATTRVVIGRENAAPGLQDCALITAPYRFNSGSNIAGTISILGPTRIEYARMIAVVSYLAKLFERFAQKND